MKKYSLVLFAGLTMAANAYGGRIVVNHDEWSTSNSGFANAGGSNALTFSQNLAAFLNIGGGAGNILIYSANFGLTESNFLNALTGAGHSVTVDNTGSTPFTLASLSAFDAIFLAGNAFSKSDAVLTSYVNSGGSVYIEAGTGLGGAAAEAALWNGFLGGFGLTLAPSYNGCCGNDAVTGTHPILAGVSQLYHNNGNTVSLAGGNPNAQIIEFGSGGQGLIGVYDDINAVPEPSTWLLLTGGLAAVALSKRKLA